MGTGSKLVAVQGDTETADLPPEAVPAHADATKWSEGHAEEWDAEVDDQDAERALSRELVVPILSVLAIGAWTAFFGWANRSILQAGAASSEWIALLTQWAVPVLLVVTTWLLAMRLSRREARRFGDAAHALSMESEQLERRLTVVNRELSLAREFLTAETRELETLGRVAASRLSEHAETLQSLVRDNGAQVDAIAGVSTTALENMDKLRDDLPVVANSARDVSNQIGSAGRTAHDQLANLVSGFERLNEFGTASDQQVETIRARIDDTLSLFDSRLAALEGASAARFAALKEQGEEYRAELASRETEALAGLRNRAVALHSELGAATVKLQEGESQALETLASRIETLRTDAAAVGTAVLEQEDAAMERWSTSVGAMQNRLTEAVQTLARIDEEALANSNSKLQALVAEAEAVDAKIAEREALFQRKLREREVQLDKQTAVALATLEARFAEFDGKVSDRYTAQEEAAAVLRDRTDVLGRELAAFREDLSAIEGLGENAQASLGAVSERLAGNLADSNAAIDQTDAALATLTESSVRLLELVRGAAEHSREDIPAALVEAEDRLAALRSEVDTIKGVIEEAVDKGEALSAYVIASRSDGQETGEAIEALHAKLAQAGHGHAEKLRDLRREIDQLGSESEAVAAKAKDDLASAIATLETALRGARDQLRDGADTQIDGFASEVGKKAATAVHKALREETEAGVSELEDRAAAAAATGREAAIQLRDQLAKVNELAGNLETRVERARERAEEQVDNDFSRRVALITESLNSNAIDIAKALSSDVADTAWASYLRGDRGIFTRRAVSLIDSTEARDIAEVYDADDAFREHVSRYIHDFEAMLRTMLSTRDGNALGVTLLSSDMGKLYVALAQALDRLRD